MMRANREDLVASLGQYAPSKDEANRTIRVDHYSEFANEGRFDCILETVSALYPLA